MEIPVGPFRYRLALVNGHIQTPSGPALGLCDTVRREILISDAVAPDHRVDVFGHEFGHAAKAELDITESPTLHEEAACNLVAMAMSLITPKLRAMIDLYLKHGIEAHDVIWLCDMPEPIPVVRLTNH